MRLALRFLAPQLLACATVAGAFAFFADEGDAHAQYYVVRRSESSVGLNLGLDLEGAAVAPTPTGYGDQGGGGFKLRIGAEIRRPWLRIIPEGGFGYTHLFVDDQGFNGGSGNEGWNMERIFGGVRIGFGEVVVPILYAHIGYGWRLGADDVGSNPIANSGGLTADGGVGLDFHLIRHFGFGFHLEYDTVQTNVAVPDWVAFGAHLDVRF
jgi:hypothetical protein